MNDGVFAFHARYIITYYIKIPPYMGLSTPEGSGSPRSSEDYNTQKAISLSMRIAATLELQDRPGHLLAALAPLSSLGGNIISIVHHRDQRTSRGNIPVQIVFEIDENKRKLLIDELEKGGIIIASIDETLLIERESVILIGHIIHSDIRDTIDCIDRTGFAEVTDIAISMPEINGESSAHILVEAVGKSELASAIQILKEVADQKNLLVIEPVRN